MCVMIQQWHAGKGVPRCGGTKRIEVVFVDRCSGGNGGTIESGLGYRC